MVLHDHRLRRGPADALDGLERWPEKVRVMQRNWIGRSEGLLVRFALDPETTPNGESELEIFTTRHDTLFGASFMAISPDHPLAAAAAKKNPGARATSSPNASAPAPPQEVIETAEKNGFDTGIDGDPSVRPGLEAAGLCREFHPDGLRHRRHLRLPGARSARPRLRQQIRPPAIRRWSARTAQDPTTFVITDTAYDGDGRMINSRFLDGMTIDAGEGRGGAAAGAARRAATGRRRSAR